MIQGLITLWQPALAKGLTGGLSVYLKPTQWLCHDPVNLVLDDNLHYPTKRYLDAEDSVALVLLLVLVQVLVLVERADGGVAGEGGDGDGVGVQGRGVVAEEAVDREGAADPEGRPADLAGQSVTQPLLVWRISDMFTGLNEISPKLGKASALWAGAFYKSICLFAPTT